MSDFYGMAPTIIGNPGSLDLSGEWHEFMDALYMPVRIPASDPGFRLPTIGRVSSDHDDRIAWAMSTPASLSFLRPAVDLAIADARKTTQHLENPYVYVTARRGYATPGNPLNRPGWHTDDFGGTDLNYIWTDRYPTAFLLSEAPLEVSPDDQASMADMARIASLAVTATDRWHEARRFNGNAKRPRLRIEHSATNTLYRLTPHVIHAAPHIPAPGGMRSFFKISVSTKRYDLLGNAHNHGLDYDWPMRRRDTTRNPTSADQR